MSNNKLTVSSRRWLQRHNQDPFIRQAKQEGYRSRAVYKLQEIHKKDRLFHTGMTIIDLGAAPGGWSQLAKKYIGDKGLVIALDILPMQPIEGVVNLQADFTEDDGLTKLQVCLKNKGVDLVLSDMAPNLLGIRTVDIPRSVYLCELAREFALKNLNIGGCLLVKIFQGEDVNDFVLSLKRHFKRVLTRKPKASRSDSAEFYILAQGFKIERNRS